MHVRNAVHIFQWKYFSLFLRTFHWLCERVFTIVMRNCMNKYSQSWCYFRLILCISYEFKFTDCLAKFYENVSSHDDTRKPYSKNKDINIQMKNIYYCVADKYQLCWLNLVDGFVNFFLSYAISFSVWIIFRWKKWK